MRWVRIKEHAAAVTREEDRMTGEAARAMQALLEDPKRGYDKEGRADSAQKFSRADSAQKFSSLTVSNEAEPKFVKHGHADFFEQDHNNKLPPRGLISTETMREERCRCQEGADWCPKCDYPLNTDVGGSGATYIYLNKV